MSRIGGIHRNTLFLAVSDTALIALGLWMADNLSSLWTLGSFSSFSDPFTEAAQWMVILLVYGLALYYNEIFNLQVTRRYSVVFIRLLQSFAVAALALGALYYVSPELSPGKEIAVLGIPISLVLILSWHLFLIKRGSLLRDAERVLMVGTSEAGISLVREILKHPELNLKVVGFLDEKGENLGKSLVNPKVIGAVSQLEEIVGRERVDHVVLSLSERRGSMPLRELVRLKLAGIRVQDTPTFHEEITGRIPLEHLSASWLILSDGFRKSRSVKSLKRAFDIVGALIGIILTLPVMILVAAAIRLESGRPILFRQRRLGLRGVPFEMLKFRSMHPDADAHGPRWTADGDCRITRVGCMLRKYRLDELPQLFNVLKGEMSLVGPRPEQPYFCTLLEKEIPFFTERHSVRPGITGWAQVKFRYGASVQDAKSKLEFDLFYIKHLSLLLDWAIILETFKVMLVSRGAK
ncbi:MAG TPA: TIGR03013 family XrtA/PEP-CTERM system glycosyltransferase [Terriglobia bacterium]|nr:TIGR03013 family XrtA/PEP-CTERM system glycosyltransferase [Terriglobia bacterium]